MSCCFVVFYKYFFPLCRSRGRRMSVEVDLLLQEAKESIEAAQNYRGELQQRLHGLNQARKQVLQPVASSLVPALPFSQMSSSGPRRSKVVDPTGVPGESTLSPPLSVIFSFPPPSRFTRPAARSKQCCYFLFLRSDNEPWRRDWWREGRGGEEPAHPKVFSTKM